MNNVILPFRPLQYDSSDCKYQVDISIDTDDITVELEWSTTSCTGGDKHFYASLTVAETEALITHLQDKIDELY